MDFGDLLRMAESNNDSKNFNPKNCLVTKVSGINVIYDGFKKLFVY